MRFNRIDAAKEQVNARVSESLKRRLQALSLRLRRSESDMAKQAIETWVNERETETELEGLGND